MPDTQLVAHTAPQTAQVESKPSTPPLNPIKELILARANQFKKDQELTAREAALKAKTPIEPPKPEVKVETTTETKPEVKVDTAPAGEAKPEPQTEDEWKQLWETEQVPQITAKVEADPKFKALKAFGLAKQVPVEMLKALKDSEGKEHLTDVQMAERMETNLRNGLKNFMNQPGFKEVLTELFAEIGTTTETKTAPIAESKVETKEPAAKEPVVIHDSLKTYVEKKQAKLAAKTPLAPATLSNRPTDTPAAKIPEDASKPLPGETFAKWRKRTGAYG